MTVSVKGNVQMEFMTFGLPNFVQVAFPKERDDSAQYKALPLSAIPDDVFATLVEQWVREMYEKANKNRPATPA